MHGRAQVETESARSAWLRTRTTCTAAARRAGARHASERSRRSCACTQRHAARPDRRARRRTHLDAARRAAAHRARGRTASSSCCATRGRRAKSPRPCIALGQRAEHARRRRRRGCCAPTASARRSCATSASPHARAVGAPPAARHRRFGLEITGYVAVTLHPIYSRPMNDSALRRRLRGGDLRIALVASRFNDVGRRAPGRRRDAAPAKHGGEPRDCYVRVPGAFELPLAAQDARRERRLRRAGRARLRDPRRDPAFRLRGRRMRARPRGCRPPPACRSPSAC